jgi:hypothetical protein
MPNKEENSDNNQNSNRNNDNDQNEQQNGFERPNQSDMRTIEKGDKSDIKKK